MTTKQRIAFVSTMDAFPWGGSEELWSRTALHMAQNGYTVGANVWKWQPVARPVAKLQEAGGQIAFRRTIRRLRPLIGDFETKRTVRWLDRFKPDFCVLSLGWHTEGVEWMRACRERRIPYLLLVQSAGEYAWPHDDDALVLAEGYEAAALCCFVSQGNRDFLRNQLATPIPKATIVRNPFNVSFDAAPPWNTSSSPLELACIGRLQCMAKGQDILFQTLGAEKWRQRPLRVTLYGSGPDAKTLERLAKMYRLENVVFGGFTADVEGLWEKHHALVLPSRFEGLPLVVVEAMLCGRPCIVTDVAGNAELIEDGVNGFVARGASVSLLDEALERAWNKREEWQKMGACAALHVRKQIPADPVAAFVNVIEESLKP